MDYFKTRESDHLITDSASSTETHISAIKLMNTLMIRMTDKTEKVVSILPIDNKDTLNRKTSMGAVDQRQTEAAKAGCNDNGFSFVYWPKMLFFSACNLVQPRAVTPGALHHLNVVSWC